MRVRRTSRSSTGWSVAERPRFHLAIPVDDLVRAQAFYVDELGAGVGRTSDRWVDLDFWGHQVTLHLAPPLPAASTNEVDRDEVPTRHFGIILEMTAWEALAERLTQALARAGRDFLVPPRLRFVGEVGEQATLFLLDPAGNALEFKAFADPEAVFRR